MSARLESVDQTRRAFLADVAHELRTPLSVVAAQLEAIEDGLYAADAEHLAPIHEQLQLMEKLIDDLRTVALAEAGGLTLHRQPLEIGALLDHTISDFQPEAKAAEIELTTEYLPGLPLVTADEQRVRQVLANLIGNALRHTRAGGHVWVSASVTTARDSIQITVRDDGSGIPADLLPNVFERFKREPGSTGSGLGLAISKDLVEAHGGTIGISSDSGTGTTVTFTLPL
jgi:signal transduction histidine kinase